MVDGCVDRFDPARVRAVLFDLDGTLLDVDMSRFIPVYLERLAGHFSDLVAPERFARTMRRLISALLEADDGRLNALVVAEVLERRLGIDPLVGAVRFRNFYVQSLAGLQSLVTPLPQAQELLLTCLERGMQVVIATNPVFPREVVAARLEWAGIGALPYALVTSLENSHYCKPHPGYFRQVLAEIGLSAAEVVMVGNDTEHDLAARKVGIPTFLVDPWLIERNGPHYSCDWRGDHTQLGIFLETLGTPGKN